VLLLHSPAGSDEGVKDAKEVKAAQPALSSETAGKIDEEIASARASVTADPSQAAARVRLGYLLQLSFLCGAYTAVTHALERESL
jgi:hypothetical protein